MKNRFPTLKPSKILSLLFCLISLNHFGICQRNTSEAFSPAFDLTEKLPEIVRDLKLCDLIKIERDTQAAYIKNLTAQLAMEVDKSSKLETDRDKFKARSKRRGRALIYIIGITAVQTGIQILRR